MADTGYGGMAHPGLLQTSLGPPAIQPGYIGQPGVGTLPVATT